MKATLCVVLSLMAVMLSAGNVLAQNCSAGMNPVFVGVGATTEFNTFAYAAVNYTTNGTFSGYTIWTTKSAQLQDTRFSAAVVDTGVGLWALWAPNASNPNICDVYAYFSIDSTTGVKDFLAVQKSSASGNGCTTCLGAYHAVFGVPGTLSGAGANLVPGLTDQASLPLPVITFLTTSPAPTSKTQLAQPYCGQLGAASSSTLYCFFNAGLTTIRPEDALYATTRALSAYNTTNGLSGLGYDQAGCGSISTNQGCVITDSFAQGKATNILNFKLSGTDPVTLATIPPYTALTTGLSPTVVFVSNADTSNTLGFGATYTDKNGKSHYTFTDINHQVLANVFDGTTACTGALLPGLPKSGNNLYDNGFLGGPPAGAGQPIQVVSREPGSGAYNTFEFTAIRTMNGSASAAVAESKVSAITWLTDNDTGQELDTNPTLNFGSAHCSAATGPDGSSQCGDPTWISTPSHPSISNNSCPGSGQDVSIRIRAIGTTEEVKAALGGYNSTTGALSPGWKVTDGIGYAAWSYGNFAAAAISGSTPGHYLTVDGIDPLFITAGGEGDSIYGQPDNPNGPFNLPQCNFKAFPCTKISFAHVYDGTYPLWEQLRTVTIANVAKKSQTPAGVINLVGYAEIEANDSKFYLSDFAPLLTNITGLPYTQGGPLPTGDLNVGVFRTHFVQSKINPSNGHSACNGIFTGISIQGGSGNTGTGTCLVDLGGEAGGAVQTIEGDVEFNKDFGSLFNSGKYESYGLHQ